jgi:1-acyl-sn-glycerol-3-phosphate acyltransferase
VGPLASDRATQLVFGEFIAPDTIAYAAIVAEPVYRPIIALVQAIFIALGLRIKVDGLEHIPRKGGAVLAINHVSYLDFALAGKAILPTKRLVRFMAKKALFDVPVIGTLLRGMRHISVDRSAGAAAYSQAVDALHRGEFIGVFPEATISKSFELKEFKSGAARMAIAAGVPIIPMVVWGGQRIWTKNRRPHLRRRGVPVHIAIGLPLQADTPEVLTASLREAMQALLTKVQTNYPDDHQGQWWAPVRLGGTAPLP